MKIETNRLILRPITIGDKESLFYYRSNKMANKYQGWIPENIQEVEEFIKKLPPIFNTPESWYQLAIIEKESQAFIGDIGVHFYGDENLQCEIGCTLDRHFQGNGFATEALNGVIDYLFKDLKKHRITTSIDPQNTASIKLVERIGFRKEAHFKESLFLNGNWVDDLVYALLEKDWISPKN